jgi:hypothetical protein
MAIAGKEEKTKAKEQQGSPENVVEKKWDGQLIDDITGGNNHKGVAFLFKVNSYSSMITLKSRVC